MATKVARTPTPPQLPTHMQPASVAAALGATAMAASAAASAAMPSSAPAGARRGSVSAQPPALPPPPERIPSSLIMRSPSSFLQLTAAVLKLELVGSAVRAFSNGVTLEAGREALLERVQELSGPIERLREVGFKLAMTMAQVVAQVLPGLSETKELESQKADLMEKIGPLAQNLESLEPREANLREDISDLQEAAFELILFFEEEFGFDEDIPDRPKTGGQEERLVKKARDLGEKLKKLLSSSESEEESSFLKTLEKALDKSDLVLENFQTQRTEFFRDLYRIACGLLGEDLPVVRSVHERIVLLESSRRDLPDLLRQWTALTHVPPIERRHLSARAEDAKRAAEEAVQKFQEYERLAPFFEQLAVQLRVEIVLEELVKVRHMIEEAKELRKQFGAENEEGARLEHQIQDLENRSRILAEGLEALKGSIPKLLNKEVRSDRFEENARDVDWARGVFVSSFRSAIKLSTSLELPKVSVSQSTSTLGHYYQSLVTLRKEHLTLEAIRALAQAEIQDPTLSQKEENPRISLERSLNVTYLSAYISFLIRLELKSMAALFLYLQNYNLPPTALKALSGLFLRVKISKLESAASLDKEKLHKKLEVLVDYAEMLRHMVSFVLFRDPSAREFSRSASEEREVPQGLPVSGVLADADLLPAAPRDLRELGSTIVRALESPFQDSESLLEQEPAALVSSSGPAARPQDSRLTSPAPRRSSPPASSCTVSAGAAADLAAAEAALGNGRVTPPASSDRTEEAADGTDSGSAASSPPANQTPPPLLPTGTLSGSSNPERRDAAAELGASSRSQVSSGPAASSLFEATPSLPSSAPPPPPQMESPSVPQASASSSSQAAVATRAAGVAALLHREQGTPGSQQSPSSAVSGSSQEPPPLPQSAPPPPPTEGSSSRRGVPTPRAEMPVSEHKDNSRAATPDSPQSGSGMPASASGDAPAAVEAPPPPPSGPPPQMGSAPTPPPEESSSRSVTPVSEPEESRPPSRKAPSPPSTSSEESSVEEAPVGSSQTPPSLPPRETSSPVSGNIPAPVVRRPPIKGAGATATGPATRLGEPSPSPEGGDAPPEEEGSPGEASRDSSGSSSHASSPAPMPAGSSEAPASRGALPIREISAAGIPPDLLGAFRESLRRLQNPEAAAPQSPVVREVAEQLAPRMEQLARLVPPRRRNAPPPTAEGQNLTQVFARLGVLAKALEAILAGQGGSLERPVQRLQGLLEAPPAPLVELRLSASSRNTSLVSAPPPPNVAPLATPPAAPVMPSASSAASTQPLLLSGSSRSLVSSAPETCPAAVRTPRGTTPQSSAFSSSVASESSSAAAARGRSSPVATPASALPSPVRDNLAVLQPSAAPLAAGILPTAPPRDAAPRSNVLEGIASSSAASTPPQSPKAALANSLPALSDAVPPTALASSRTTPQPKGGDQNPAPSSLSSTGMSASASVAPLGGALVVYNPNRSREIPTQLRETIREAVRLLQEPERNVGTRPSAEENAVLAALQRAVADSQGRNESFNSALNLLRAVLGAFLVGNVARDAPQQAIASIQSALSSADSSTASPSATRTAPATSSPAPSGSVPPTVPPLANPPTSVGGALVPYHRPQKIPLPGDLQVVIRKAVQLLEGPPRSSPSESPEESQLKLMLETAVKNLLPLNEEVSNRLYNAQMRVLLAMVRLYLLGKASAEDMAKATDGMRRVFPGIHEREPLLILAPLPAAGSAPLPPSIPVATTLGAGHPTTGMTATSAEDAAASSRVRGAAPASSAPVLTAGAMAAATAAGQPVAATSVEGAAASSTVRGAAPAPSAPVGVVASTAAAEVALEDESSEEEGSDDEVDAERMILFLRETFREALRDGLDPPDAEESMESLRAKILAKYPRKEKVPRREKVSDLERTARAEAALTSDARKEAIRREVSVRLLKFQCRSFARIIYDQQGVHPWGPLSRLKVTLDAFLHWFKEKATPDDFRRVGATFVKWYEVKRNEGAESAASEESASLPDFHTWYEAEGQAILDSTSAAESWSRWAAQRKFPRNTDWKDAGAFLSWLFESESAAYQAKMALGLVKRPKTDYPLWQGSAASRPAGAAAAAAAALAAEAPPIVVPSAQPAPEPPPPSASVRSRFSSEVGTVRAGAPESSSTRSKSAGPPRPPGFARGTAASSAKSGNQTPLQRGTPTASPQGSVSGRAGRHNRRGSLTDVFEEGAPTLAGGGGGGGGSASAQRLLELAAAARRGRTRAGGSGTFVAGPNLEEEDEYVSG